MIIVVVIIIIIYFWDRVILFEIASGVVRREMMCGVSQGLVLGPLLWNSLMESYKLKYQLESVSFAMQMTL